MTKKATMVKNAGTTIATKTSEISFYARFAEFMRTNESVFGFGDILERKPRREIEMYK